MQTVEFYKKKSGVLVDGLAEVLRRSPNAAIFLHEVKASLVDDYIGQRREDGASESSIAKELATWRAAMRIAKRRRLWFADIDEVFPVGFSPEYKPRKRFLTPEEFLALYRAMVRPVPVRQPELPPEQITELRARRAAGERRDELAKAFGVSIATVTRMTSARRIELEAEERPVEGHHMFAIVCFSIATSAEWSAIWRARREDIAPDLSHVRVRGSKNTYRDRPVPLELAAFGYLLDFARRYGDGELADAEGTFLFRGSHAAAFRRTLRDACRRAGIPPLSPNDLRRTHGKWLRLSGVHPSAIAPSMGHADDRMAQRVYAQSSALELAGVQRAQIATGAELLMGGRAPISPSLASPGHDADPESPAEKPCPGTESNRRHGDFQSYSGGRENTAIGGKTPTQWDANGKAPQPSGTESGDPEPPQRVTDAPTSDVDDVRPRTPGVAKAGPVLEESPDGAVEGSAEAAAVLVAGMRGRLP